MAAKKIAKKAPAKKRGRPRKAAEQAATKPAHVAEPSGATAAVRMAAALGKKFHGRILTVHDDLRAMAEINEFIPTGVDVIDRYIIGRGGFPVGRMSETFGEEGALLGTSRVAFAIVDTRTGKYVNSKGGTMKQLHERFHDLPKRVGAPRASREHLRFLAPSVNEEGRIVANAIAGVVSTGNQRCYAVTCGKHTLSATFDHPFLTPNGYVELQHLRVGDQVMLHLNTPFTGRAAKQTGARRESSFKHHPQGSRHVVTGNVYYRVRRARAVYEAYLNGMSFSEFAARLNSGKLTGLTFLGRDLHVHHKDDDYTNDAIDNLIPLSCADHSRTHALAGHNKLRFCVQPHVIDRIEDIGVHATYDIKMADPLRNYVANGFAVHNCGKTALALSTLAQAQRMGGVAVLADAEQSFDRERAETMGVNLSDLILLQPENLEELFEMVKGTLHMHKPAYGPMLLAWDSIASTRTKHGLISEAGEKKVADVPLMMSEELPKILQLLPKHRAHFMMLNQIRNKIGVMFGSNITTPGGNAPKFYSSVRLQFFGGKAIKKDERHIAKVVTIMAVKNRLQAPFAKGRIRFDYDSGYNNMYSTLEHAKTRKLITPREGGFKGKGKAGQEAYLEAMRKLGWAVAPSPVPSPTADTFTIEDDDDTDADDIEDTDEEETEEELDD